MNEHLYRWRNKERREHVSVIEGTIAPTILLKNATYLNVHMRQWLKGHIWVYQDRIVYVGDQLPAESEETEVVECEGHYLVPGYIEPHVHPFQLYNPHQFASYASLSGTTTLICDNLMWLFLLQQKKAFTLLDDFSKLPVSMYWWTRFDSQTELQDPQELFTNENMLDWIRHEAVMQGGELTGWPQVMKDDDRILYWMQEAKRHKMPIEGHFPGASERTLVKMELLGADADHESMTGKEAIDRLRLGYQVGLRYSSIRPDLPKLLREIREAGVEHYGQFTMNTDGSTPSFYEKGVMNQCIRIAIDEGVPLVDAYMMASYNSAKHLRLEDRLGSIAPGRVAHINILQAKEEPDPVSVLAKGQWMKRNGKKVDQTDEMEWEKYGIDKLQLDWSIDHSDLQFSLPIGVEMSNDVIMRPYAIRIDATVDEIQHNFEEAFLMLVDRFGEWRVNTIIKGFTNELGGLASSFSNTGDIILIGKDKEDILLAFNRMKEIGGGIVLVQNGEVIFELPLSLAGMMYDGPMEELMEKEKQLKEKLKALGFSFYDPVYTLLFLSSTHLPFIRITPRGLVDVKRKEVLFPAIMR